MMAKVINLDVVKSKSAKKIVVVDVDSVLLDGKYEIKLLRRDGWGFNGYFKLAEMKRIEWEELLFDNNLIEVFRLKKRMKSDVAGEMSGRENTRFLIEFLKENKI